MDRRCWALLITLFLLIVPPLASSQAPHAAEGFHFYAGFNCPGEIAGLREAGSPSRLSFASYLWSESDCAGAELRDGWRGAVHRPVHALAPGAPPTHADLVDVQLAENNLQAMGAQGFAIARARRHVLVILLENSACAAWYAQAEPQPAVKFASLLFRIDLAGEDTTLGDYDGLGWSFREPYVARAQQDVGAGSTITLNRHGAFFVWRAPAKSRLGIGGPFVPQSARPVHVAAYAGGSLNAQVLTLLHEYAHVVGLLPVDSGEPGSPLLSTQNTDTVQQHCRKQVEASARRMIVLPASLSALETKATPIQ